MKLLKELTQLGGIAGHERQVKSYIHQAIKPLVDDILEDHLGSIIGVKGTKGPKIMIAGHMDEIGLIISSITKEGFIKFQTIGGWFSQVMLAQLWDIHTKKGIITGVTGVKPPHLIPLAERAKTIEIDAMYIDIGVTSKEEALEKGIEIGQMITPHNEFMTLANSKFHMAKAMDNRLGCAVVIEVLKRVNPTECQVFGAFTVQEEVGLRGAKTSSYVVNPDIAISIDTGVGNDVPSGEPEEQRLGKGPQIMIFDRTLIGHPNLRAHLKKIATQNNIPYQEPFIKQGGTDAGNMHLNGKGAPAVSLNVPTRYMHSHYSIIHEDDFEHTVLLLVNFINHFNESILNEILN
jgi:putative aminopeptidase FrvX